MKTLMFLFSVTVEADLNNKIYPAGEKHAALVYVVADDDKQAEDRLASELNQLNWWNITLQKRGAVNESSIVGNDKTLVDAYNTASKVGFSVIIYEDPIK